MANFLRIDGKALALVVQSELGQEVQTISKSLNRAPGLAVILVGDNPASHVYVASKERAATNCGITPFDFRLPGTASQKELLDLIQTLNSRADVDGILLQLPLPKGFDEESAIGAIAPEKDVDGLTATSQGHLLRDAPIFEPCTPKGVMALIEDTRKKLGLSADLSGLRALVIGRSSLVGKPVALMLLRRNCTVTMAHSRTVGLEEECRRADILIAAVGRPQMVKQEWIKPGSLVLDVGINRLPDGKLVGDVDFDGATAVAGAATPVPGGVGPMTIAMLLKNTVESARRKIQRD